jgi:hypothetical protein
MKGVAGHEIHGLGRTTTPLRSRAEDNIAYLDRAMSRLNPQTRGLAYSKPGGVIHDGKEKWINRLSIFLRRGLVIGEAGERTIAHVALE